MIFTPLSVSLTAIFIAAAIAYAVFAELSAQPSVIPQHHAAELLELDRRAIKTAYEQQVVHLFQQWMRDGMQQPERALRGIRQAQNAYVQAMDALDQREKAR